MSSCWRTWPSRHANSPIRCILSPTTRWHFWSKPSHDPSLPLTPSPMRLSARRLADRTSIPVDDGRFIWENFRVATMLIDVGPHTVLRGDSHPGNTYFRDGRAGLLDRQVVRRGHPARDLTYTLVLGMTTEDRRAIERDLLEVYRQALAAGG